MPSVFDHPRFKNEEAAYAWVEAQVWVNGRFCPHCGVIGKSGPLKGKSTRIGVYKCYACRKPFSVKVGTIFEASHVPIHLWLQAIHLVCSSKKGISANQLHRVLGVDLKTAWFMGHRIRLAMDESVKGPLGGEGKTVEVDETYYGHKEGVEAQEAKWEFHNQLGWVKSYAGGVKTKIPVVTLVERAGRARSVKVERVTGENLRAAVFGNADTKSILMTDELGSYRRVGRRFARHETVNHSEEEYARRLDDGTKASTNTVEGYFSIFKRGMVGVYQHCEERHLHRYLAEFDFRYSNRIRLGVDDDERTERAVKGVVGKRLTYRTTDRQADQATSA
jgi:transposase-like protein